MKEKDNFTKWTSRIEESTRLLASRITDADRSLRYYRQDLLEEDSPKGDTVWINHWFAASRIILPSIYFKNPEVLISARRQDHLEHLCAKAKEKVLNYQLEEFDFEGEMRRIIFDALHWGYGVMKFGFAPALERKKAISEAMSDLTFESLFEEPPAERYAIDDRISGEHPFFLRTSPRYFRMDPLATTEADARWVGHLILKPVEQVKNSKLYPKSLVSGIEGTHRLSEERFLNEADAPPSFFSGMFRKKEAADLVLIYEIWDKENDELLVLDSYHAQKNDNRFLRVEKWPYRIEGFPFHLLIFNADPDSPLGIPDAKMWENPMQGINLIHSMHYNHIKRFTRKYIGQMGVLEQGVEAKLTAPYDGMVVEVSGGPDSIKPLEDAPMTPDAYNLRDILKNELVQITGITKQREGVSDRQKTATEASIMEQQARIRDSDRLYIVSRFVERACKKILQLDREFLSPETVNDILGPGESPLWILVAPDIWKAETDVKVRVGSSAFMSQEVRTKQLLDAFNLTAQLLDPATGMPVINMTEFVRRIFDALDLEDYNSLLLMPSMDATQQMMQQQQMGMAGPMATASPMQPNGPVPGGNGPAIQSPARRTGGTNLGDILSGVQNVSARRAPNPTSELGQR